MRISIVIPTRERASYLRHSLATALAIDDAEVEILVSDNASNDETEAVVAAVDDPRVRYVNTGARVSMRQNFEFALKQSTGEYVIYFGDDDAILPRQFPILRSVLEAQRPDGLSWDYPVYGWPVGDYGGRVGGIRFARERLFGPPQPLNTVQRRKVCESGQLHLLHPLPAIYHGAMSRDYLDRISRADGTCFLSCSPDTYISFRSVQYGGHFLHANHAFSINGHSPASNGGAFATFGNRGGPTKAPRFLEEQRTDPIEDVIPLRGSMAMGFFGVFESVRHHFPEPPLSPDYESWYVAILSEMERKNPETRENIREALEAHAERTETAAALAAARQNPGIRWRKWASRWERARGRLFSFRLVALENGENTIMTAARLYDRILDSDLAMVMSGKLNRREAWARARRRRSEVARG